MVKLTLSKQRREKERWFQQNEQEGKLKDKELIKGDE